MSMISSQCDELRDWACELRNLANGPVNEGFPAREKLFESADAMCQAADTILELRCKLAGVVDQSDEIEWLKDENVKLREFSARLYKHLCITEVYMRGSGYDSFDYYDARMRELRIGEEPHVND